MSAPGEATAQGATNTVAPGGATGQQDALGECSVSRDVCAAHRTIPLTADKGIDGILGKAGHKQSAGTTEKISDGVRSLFKKVRPTCGD